MKAFAWFVLGMVSLGAVAFFLYMAVMVALQSGDVRAHEAPASEHQHDAKPINFGFYGGVGFNDSEGSGAIQAETMLGSVKVFVQAWTDNDESQIIIQPPRQGSKIPAVLELDGGDTSNVALGGAYCLNFVQYGRGCLGGAYLTEDDNANVDDSIGLYWEIGGKLPKAQDWRIFVNGFGDDELFLMGGRTF